jgi:hypothetical protein
MGFERATVQVETVSSVHFYEYIIRIQYMV